MFMNSLIVFGNPVREERKQGPRYNGGIAHFFFLFIGELYISQIIHFKLDPTALMKHLLCESKHLCTSLT